MVNDGLFKEGKVLYFTPFFFKDKDGGQKSKYYIVLKKLDQEVVLASLPTSKDFVPSSIEKVHGCIDHPDINFNCYYFAAGQKICSNGFCFPIETYVYGYRLQTHKIADFIMQAEKGETVITEKGQLVVEEYSAIVDCLKMSPAVKRGYRNVLMG